MRDAAAGRRRAGKDRDDQRSPRRHLQHQSEADRAFLRDIVGLPWVDVGHGWLVFGLPAAEIAVHPAERGGRHEIYFTCTDIERFAAEMTARGVNCSGIQAQPWGLLTEVSLPGGGSIGVYQPRHAQPPA